MKINEIIRCKRRELGLTQEQAAHRLGVSASAFNKWERGASLPDITLLPGLARLRTGGAPAHKAHGQHGRGRQRRQRQCREKRRP